MKRLVWEKTDDKNFLYTMPEKKYFYRIEIKNDRHYGMQYIAELWYDKHEDFGRLSPWAYVDCNTLEKAKAIIRKHYREILMKRKK